MKVFALVLVLAVLMVSTLSASETSGTNWTTPSSSANSWLNQYATHGHGYDQTSKYKSPLGLELDVTLYRMDILNVPCAVGVDTTYDMNNGVWGCFGKMSIDLSPTIEKLTGQK